MKLLKPAKIILKTVGIIFIALSFFYVGKHWSNYYDYQQYIFFNSYSVSLSPNVNKSFDLTTLPMAAPPLQMSRVVDNGGPSKAPPPENVVAAPPVVVEAVQRLGVVDENGVMRDDFEVGVFDVEVVEIWGNKSEVAERGGGARVKVGRFKECEVSMREYIPCLDNVVAEKNGEKFERHCQEKDMGLDCLVPTPKGYKAPIPWPRSRDEMIPAIAFGRQTRVVLDVGCGVASFGAYLASRNVLTMSVAPKEVHENHIQFALERGVPAMVAVFATRRLLYPSQAFDLIHCSRCRVNWTRDDGILLLEVNRLLRAGGYFVWAAQPVYKHEPLLEEQWQEMINLTNRICWNLVKKEGYIAIWQKPLDNNCYLSRDAQTQPPLCDKEDNPDDVWYVNLKPCITPLPEDGSGANITTWPARLHNPPERLQSIKIDAFVSRKDLFKAESKYWKKIIDSYVRSFRKKFKFRNVMDMRAGFGGFAAALIDNQLDCWVMNVVPVSGPNTLPVIYDRGLLGVRHDWCEAFDTYPRTYDLLHAAGLFSIEQKGCNISSIMLEMNRILRPGGHVYIRDSILVIDELQEIGKAIGWRVTMRDTSEGPHASYRILICDKRLR